MTAFSELYGSLLDQELGSDDTLQLFTNVRRKAAINRAQKEFNRLTECFQIRGSITPLLDEVSEYDIETTLTDFLWLAQDGVEILHDDGTSGIWIAGEDLVRRDIPWLDRYQPGWRQASAGTPSAYYIRKTGGIHDLGFYPAPSVAAGHTWSAVITYIADPADMSADGDEPYTASSNVAIALRPWHQALVHFAASQLEKLRKNYAVSSEQRQLFASYVADYLQKQRRKGGQQVNFARNYLGDVSRSRPEDPRR